MDWHVWQNVFAGVENWVRDIIGAGKVATGFHHLRVLANTDDDCTFSSHGGDNSKSFDSVWTGLDLTKSRPILSKKKSESCADNARKVDCVAYTSEYKQYVGISMKGFDLSIKLATSSYTLKVCADGTKSIEDENHDP